MINSHVELNIEERKVLARLLHHKTRIAELRACCRGIALQSTAR